jgi:hypothetical protein
MNIPTIDLSPVIQAFRTYEEIKGKATSGGALGTIARTGLDVAEIGWKYYQSNDVTNAQAHTQKIQEKYQDLQNQMFLGPSNNGIDAEQFQQAVDQLGDELKAYKPRTPAGESVIADYSVNGFAQNTEAMVRQVAPILIKNQTDILYSTLTEAGVESAKNGDPEYFLNKLSTLESGVARAREGEASAQAAVASATDEEALADQDLARYAEQGEYAQQYGQGQAYQGSAGERAAIEEKKAAKAKAREEAVKNAGLQSEAVKSAAVAFEQAQAAGTDPYRTLVREQVESSKLFTSTQIDEITDSFVNKRNNIFANNNVQARINGGDYVGALQYVNDHTGYYPDADAVKAARTEIETQRDGFTTKKYRGYVGTAQQPENWDNPYRLKQFIQQIGKDIQYNTQGTEGSTGSNTAIDELTRRYDDLIISVKTGSENEKVNAANEMWKVYDAWDRGDYGTDVAMALTHLDQKAVEFGDLINYKTGFLDIRDKIIGAGKTSDAGKFYIKKAADYAESLTKDKSGKKTKTGKALERAGNIGVVVRDEMTRYAMNHSTAEEPELEKVFSGLTEKAIGQALDELSKTPERGLSDKKGLGWLSEYEADIAAGKAGPLVNYSMEQGRLVVNPEISAAFETRTKMVNDLFKTQHPELQIGSVDGKIIPGKTAIPYIDEDGKMTYYVPKADGNIDIYHVATNAKGDKKKGPSGVYFTKEGEEGKASVNPNNPQVKAFKQASLDAVRAIESGNVTGPKAEAIKAKLKDAFDNYPAQGDENTTLYNDLQKRLSWGGLGRKVADIGKKESSGPITEAKTVLSEIGTTFDDNTGFLVNQLKDLKGQLERMPKVAGETDDMITQRKETIAEIDKRIKEYGTWKYNKENRR